MIWIFNVTDQYLLYKKIKVFQKTFHTFGCTAVKYINLSKYKNLIENKFNGGFFGKSLGQFAHFFS